MTITMIAEDQSVKVLFQKCSVALLDVPDELHVAINERERHLSRSKVCFRGDNGMASLPCLGPFE